jgi:hypothetical protein
MRKFFHSDSPRAQVLLVAFLLLTGLPGCTMLATGLWIVNPNDRPARFEGLQKRRVAVICRPNTTLALQNYGVDHDIAEAVTQKIRAHVKDVECVDQSEILDWTDENQLQSLSEFGKAMQAGAVVAIEISEFKLYRGKNMFQGVAAIDVEVYDVNEQRVAYSLEPIDSVYPPENGIPFDLFNQKNAEKRFRKKFVGVLADQISRNFYPYDSRDAVKIDRFYSE